MIAGLTAQGEHFKLDGKPFRILSGSFHYFRTHPTQWQQRLLKMKAAGLNTVTTYVPWNLHEEKEGTFEFDGLWNIVKFIKDVQMVGLKLIIRPGPYICSEWEFGGLPSWLLGRKGIQVRSSKSQHYLEKVERYFSKLLPIFVPHQHSKGGPIIAFQVENEFGHYNHDLEYMEMLRKLFNNAGITELLFTSDNGNYLERGILPNTLAMVNFRSDVQRNIGQLKKLQPDRPVMVAEFWVGWFDHWGEKHHKVNTNELVELIERVLDTGASINFYMFVGGTNFGFWNGANFGSIPTITSYDYDAPISESGDLTQKAVAIRDLFIKKDLVSFSDLPTLPEPTPPTAYGSVKITDCMSYTDLVDLVKVNLKRHISDLKSPVFMEYLNYTHGGNAGYGWMIYQSIINKSGKLSIDGSIRDRAQIFLDSKPVGVVEYEQDTVKELNLPSFSGAVTLDIVVENMGRVNYGRGKGTQSLDMQNKGLQGTVSIDGQGIEKWDCIPLEFSEKFNTNILSSSQKWRPFQTNVFPAVYRGYLVLDSQPVDTFIDMRTWRKGIVLVNGFNLGRYWNVGPQQTLYVPYPLLKKGRNEFIVFELHQPQSNITFVSKPTLDEARPELLH